MSREHQEARIRARHKNADHFVDRLIKMYDFYEPAGKDEPNTIQCVIHSHLFINVYLIKKTCHEMT